MVVNGGREVVRFRPPEFHPVLLVVDMQNGFCATGGSYEKYGGNIGADLNAYREIIPNIAKLIATARELGIPSMADLGIKESDLENIAQKTMDDGVFFFVPIKMEFDDVFSAVKKLYAMG